MSRRALLLLFVLLSGCCSSSVFERDYACEARYERSRAAAERGWESVEHGLAPQPHPTLHDRVARTVGMDASEAKEALGAPPRREDDGHAERWVYPGLVVFIEDGKVAGWEER